MPGCSVFGLCQYETNKLVRIQSVRLGSLKWSLNGFILLFICIMMLWNRKYQEFDLVVSSVTTKVKGVAQTHLPGGENVVWDVVDYSGPLQDKNSFFVVTNVIETKNQKRGKCPEVPLKGKLCRTDKDCEKGAWDQQSHGIQTGSCVRFDTLRKTCEVSAWCPVETKTKPPKYVPLSSYQIRTGEFNTLWSFCGTKRQALLEAAENFTVLIKNNIRFPAFNFIRRNILPQMNDEYLRSCQRVNDSLCPIFRLGDIVREAGEKFSVMAVEGGVIGILIKWDCNLDRLMQRCLPKYSFRRLDEKESNKTLYPGLNFRYAKYNTVNGVEERTLYKAFGIRFDVMVFGQAGKFSFIQLIIYIGSTLSYYALTTVLIDWLIGTSCYSAEVGQNYNEKKVESVQDKEKCVLCVSYVDENNIRLVKRSQKKRLQDLKPMTVQPRKEDTGHLRAVLSLIQPAVGVDRDAPLDHKDLDQDLNPEPRPGVVSPPAGGRPPVPGPSVPTAGQRPDRRPLRHCAYRQYISWRLGSGSRPTTPTPPSLAAACGESGRSTRAWTESTAASGLTGRQPAAMQACANGEL
ncbi:hypothetical protein L3Q82_023378 [Scortum barcoo]|uniref:Uncharacterized protein n=1 Tax=Scortum barcoo TaxID=214431 RepID=A0ACB8WYM4_9TELE|nr:hypothetical protein L3Q82_023378 [Scortum barcoo]